MNVEEKGETIAPKEEPGGKEQIFTIDSIRLSGGKVRFADASLGSPFKTALGDIRIDVNGLGTAQGKKADALVSFSTEAGEAFELKGNLTLSPLASEGTVALAKVVLKKYAPYFSDAVRFDIHSGTLDARSGYRFAQGDERAGIPALRPGSVRIGPSAASAGGEGGVPRTSRVRRERGRGRPRQEGDHDRRDRHGERIGCRAPFRRRGNERLPPGAGRRAIRGAGRREGSADEIRGEKAGGEAVGDHASRKRSSTGTP